MLIGRIVGPFGVRGEAKVELFTDFPDRFLHLKSLAVGADHVETAVESSRRHKGRVLLKFRGIESPEAIDELRGAELFVDRDQAVTLPEGHYFLDDLLGMEVVAEDGETVGAISEVIRTGSNDVYVVSGLGATVLIPGIRDAIAELDLGKKRIVVRRWALEPAV